MLQKPYPYDPKKLEAEVTAVVKIKDIEELYALKEQVSVKWWETGLILILFASGFGFILTVSKLISISHPLVYWFSLFWVIAIILTLIGCIEFLIAKFRALRRLYEVHTRILAGIQNELNEIRKRLPPLPSPEEKKND
ncbi:hypothetical protein JW926_01515 [Candidatus Sumerlaeota bacterium]|nr:hypothetical protein [Candidatus Sumerlaeota bacterium]